VLCDPVPIVVFLVVVLLGILKQARLPAIL